MHNVDFPDATGPTTIVSLDVGTSRLILLRLISSFFQPKFPSKMLIAVWVFSPASSDPESSFSGFDGLGCSMRKSTRESFSRKAWILSRQAKAARRLGLFWKRRLRGSAKRSRYEIDVKIVETSRVRDVTAKVTTGLSITGLYPTVRIMM